MFLLLVVCVIASIVFEDQLIEKARKTISRQMGIELNAKDLSVSAFSNFPNLSIEAQNMVIEGKNYQHLLEVKDLELIVGLSSLTSESLNIKDLVLSNGKISFIKETYRTTKRQKALQRG